MPFTVGVEIEFNRWRIEGEQFLTTYRGRTLGTMADDLASMYGLDIGREMSRWIYRTDGTCGYELVSPILKSNLEGIDTAIDFLQSNGASYDTRCGLHVHLGFRDVSPEAQKRLFAFLCRYESAFFALANDSRQHNAFCTPIEEEVYKRLKAGEGVSAWNGDRHLRYSWVNGQAFFKHGTLEFRLMESSLDAEFVRGWINFLLHVVDNLVNVESKPAVYSKEKGSKTSVPFQIHDMLQRCGSYGKGIVRDKDRAVAARKWVFSRYKRLYGKGFRAEVNAKCNKPAPARTQGLDRNPLLGIDRNPLGIAPFRISSL
jgi:hypothetical protein